MPALKGKLWIVCSSWTQLGYSASGKRQLQVLLAKFFSPSYSSNQGLLDPGYLRLLRSATSSA